MKSAEKMMNHFNMFLPVQNIWKLHSTDEAQGMSFAARLSKNCVEQIQMFVILGLSMNSVD